MSTDGRPVRLELSSRYVRHECVKVLDPRQQEPIEVVIVGAVPNREATAYVGLRLLPEVRFGSKKVYDALHTYGLFLPGYRKLVEPYPISFTEKSIVPSAEYPFLASRDRQVLSEILTAFFPASRSFPTKNAYEAQLQIPTETSEFFTPGTIIRKPGRFPETFWKEDANIQKSSRPHVVVSSVAYQQETGHVLTMALVTRQHVNDLDISVDALRLHDGTTRHHPGRITPYLQTSTVSELRKQFQLRYQHRVPEYLRFGDFQSVLSAIKFLYDPRAEPKTLKSIQEKTRAALAGNTAVVTHSTGASVEVQKIGSVSHAVTASASVIRYGQGTPSYRSGDIVSVKDPRFQTTLLYAIAGAKRADVYAEYTGFPIKSGKMRPQSTDLKFTDAPFFLTPEPVAFTEQHIDRSVPAQLLSAADTQLLQAVFSALFSHAALEHPASKDVYAQRHQQTSALLGFFLPGEIVRQPGVFSNEFWDTGESTSRHPRPHVIVSSEDYQRRTGKAIAMMLLSTSSRKGGDFAIQSFQTLEDTAPVPTTLGRLLPVFQSIAINDLRATRTFRDGKTEFLSHADFRRLLQYLRKLYTIDVSLKTFTDVQKCALPSSLVKPSRRLQPARV